MHSCACIKMLMQYYIWARDLSFAKASLLAGESLTPAGRGTRKAREVMTFIGNKNTIEKREAAFRLIQNIFS